MLGVVIVHNILALGVKQLIRGIASRIRDWDLMVKYSAKAKCDLFRDPFVSKSAHLLEKKLMSDAG